MKQIETKQRMKGENPHLCKLQMESRVLQIAKADSVFNGVYCLNFIQNVSCLPCLLWCHFEKFSVETPLTFFDS